MRFWNYYKIRIKSLHFYTTVATPGQDGSRRARVCTRACAKGRRRRQQSRAPWPTRRCCGPARPRARCTARQHAFRARCKERSPLHQPSCSVCAVTCVCCPPARGKICRDVARRGGAGVPLRRRRGRALLECGQQPTSNEFRAIHLLTCDTAGSADGQRLSARGGRRGPQR